MSIHVCKCGDEYHLRYPGLTKQEAQSIADRINGGELTISGDALRLMKFYQVNNLVALVTVQANHIERLQAKIQPIKDQFHRTPREG